MRAVARDDPARESDAPAAPLVLALVTGDAQELRRNRPRCREPVPPTEVPLAELAELLRCVGEQIALPHCGRLSFSS